MNLLTYAVSDKLKRSGELLEYIGQDSIPSSVVETSFRTLLADYEDKEATQLIEDYPSFLREQVGVAITPTTSGVQVKGDINDNVIDIIEILHKKSKKEIVEGVVHNTLNAINPDRGHKIIDLQLSDKLVQLKRQVSQTSKLVERIDGVGLVTFEEPDTQEHPVVDLVEEVAVPTFDEQVNSVVAGPAVASVETPVVAAVPEPVAVIPEHGVADELPLDVSTELDLDNIVTDLPEVPVENKIESNVEQKVEDENVSAQGVLQETWKNFIGDLKKFDMGSRMDFDPELGLAL